MNFINLQQHQSIGLLKDLFLGLMNQEDCERKLNTSQHMIVLAFSVLLLERFEIGSKLV
jgi:hypothetical protein